MKKYVNKRKIKSAKTLERRMVHKKFRVGPFVQVTKETKKARQKKTKIYSNRIRPKKSKLESTVRVLSVSHCKSSMVQKSF